MRLLSQTGVISYRIKYHLSDSMHEYTVVDYNVRHQYHPNQSQRDPCQIPRLPLSQLSLARPHVQ